MADPSQPARHGSDLSEFLAPADPALDVTAPVRVRALYDEAFARWRTIALWNVTRFPHPSLADCLVIARRLHLDGDLPALFHAETIEDVVRAAR